MVCNSADEIVAAIERLPVCGEAVIVREGRKPLAAIIPMKDLRLYERLLAQEEDRLDAAAIAESRASAGPRESWAQVKSGLERQRRSGAPN
jgi:hypothetical protein